ncbi:MAG: LysM peptidoglycan-binding domain-containing protein [Anaerolineales bacterium]
MSKSIRLVLVSIILALALFVQARPVEASHIVHVVQPGETLFRIGLRYGLLVTTLKAANGLTSDTIYVGQQLVIPHSNIVAAQADPATNGVHIVQRGENLFRIGLKYGVTVDALMAANGLSGATIYAGQRLTIPGANAIVASAAPETAVPNNPIAGIEGKHFVVDLSEQRIYAYENETLLMTTLVSTGLPGTPTVTGLYYIYLKRESQRLRGPGYDLPNVPYLMYFYQGYAIHGTYWHNDFGRPKSRGCVNLPTPQAEWAYNWAPIGTPVLVQP